MRTTACEAIPPKKQLLCQVYLRVVRYCANRNSWGITLELTSVQVWWRRICFQHWTYHQYRTGSFCIQLLKRQCNSNIEANWSFFTLLSTSAPNVESLQKSSHTQGDLLASRNPNRFRIPNFLMTGPPGLDDGPPPVISERWFRFTPWILYSYLRTINHSDIGVMCTNWTLSWGPTL